MTKHADDIDATLLINPYYAVSISNGMFSSQRNKSAREDWLLLNAHLMNEIGIDTWLSELLDALVLKDDDYNGHDIVRPNLTIQLSRNFAGEHEPLVTRELWIETNAKLAKELGVHAWLDELLDTLRG